VGVGSRSIEIFQLFYLKFLISFGCLEKFEFIVKIGEDYSKIKKREKENFGVQESIFVREI